MAFHLPAAGVRAAHVVCGDPSPFCMATAVVTTDNTADVGHYHNHGGLCPVFSCGLAAADWLMQAFFSLLAAVFNASSSRENLSVLEVVVPDTLSLALWSAIVSFIVAAAVERNEMGWATACGAASLWYVPSAF
jgi:ammonia channel protein AmtB